MKGELIYLKPTRKERLRGFYSKLRRREWIVITMEQPDIKLEEVLPEQGSKSPNPTPIDNATLVRRDIWPAARH